MILVGGAGGHVGSELVRVLGKAGTPFRAGFRTAAKAAAAALPAGAVAVELDYARLDTVRAALEGVDRLFLVSTSSPELAIHEMSVVDVAVSSGVRHVALLSAFGAQTDAFVLGQMHREVEKKLLASPLEWTFLRPSSFMQNLLYHSADSLRSEGKLYMACGDGMISHVDIRDVAEVAARVLTANGHTRRIYDLTGPDSLSYADVARRLSSVLGRKIQHVDVPPEKYREAMMAGGVPEWTARALLDLYAFYRENRASAVSPAISHVLGRGPQSFDRWARENAAAFTA